MRPESNPYCGPRSFRTGERLHGRDREVRDLLDLLAAERIVLLYSPSGAGKTSLIQAALLPALMEDYQVLPLVRPGVALADEQATPSGNPFVRRILKTWEAHAAAQGETALDSVDGIPLGVYLAQRSWVCTGRPLKLLVLDQFEEVLTNDPGAVDAKRDFFRELGEALKDPMLWALFSMREEYSAALDAYRQLLPTRLANRYRLDLLRREEAAHCIARPAAAAGLTLEGPVVDRLLDDLGTVRERTSDGRETRRQVPYIEPLYLQIVCQRLWDRLPEGTETLTPELLESTGVNQVEDALEDYYASVLREVARETGHRERAIRDWLESELVTPLGLRRQVLRGAEDTAGMPNAVVEALAERSLLRADVRGGTDWFEITHDRLAAVVQDGNARWYVEHLEPFQIRAAHWERLRRSGADPGREALGWTELQRARGWAKSNPGRLSLVDQAFLADSDRRCRQRFRDRGLVAGVLGILVIAAVVLAVFQWLNAVHERQLNEQLRVQSAKEHSRALLAEAANQRWYHQDNELAALLTLLAHRSVPGLDVAEYIGAYGQQQLRTMLQARPFSFRVPIGGGELLVGREAALSRSGELVAYALDAQRVRVAATARGIRSDRDRSGTPLFELPLDSPLVALRFAPDGTRLDVLTAAGLRRFDMDGLASGGQGRAAADPSLELATDSPPTGAQCSDDAGHLYLATEAGAIQAWDLGHGPPVAHATIPAQALADTEGARLQALECDPRGEWLAWGDSHGTVGLVDLTLAPPRTLRRLPNPFDLWPPDERKGLEERKQYLVYGVVALHRIPDRDLLYVLHTHGPDRLIDLTPGPCGARAAFLAPNDESAAALGLARARGRAPRLGVDPEHMIESDLSDDRTRITVGGRRSTVAWWDLGSLSTDPRERQFPIDFLAHGQILYADYASVPGLGTALRTLRFTEPRRAPGAASGEVGEAGGDWLAAVDAKADLYWWALRGFPQTGHRETQSRVGTVYALAFLDPEGTRLAYGGTLGSGILDLPADGGSPVHESGIELPPRVRAMAVSPASGRLLIATGSINPEKVPGLEARAQGWEPSRYSWLLEGLESASGAAPRERRAFALPVLHDAGQWAAGVSSAGDLLAIGGWDGVVGLYRRADDPDRPWRTHSIGPLRVQGGTSKDPVYALAIDPRGRDIVVGTKAGQVILLRRRAPAPDVPEGLGFEPHATLQAAGGWVNGLAYAPDGSKLISGDRDGVLRSWPFDGEVYGEPRVIPAHRDAVAAIAFGVDGRLVSGGGDAAVFMWEPGDLDPNRRLRLQGAGSEVRSVAISESGNRIAAGTALGQIHIWEMNLDRVLERVCAGMYRNLSWSEWQAHVGRDRYQCTCRNLPPAWDVPPERIEPGACPAAGGPFTAGP